MGNPGGKMTEIEYKQEVAKLVFDRPKWELPVRKSGESPEHHLQRLKAFKARYFEAVEKIEHGRNLSWL